MIRATLVLIGMAFFCAVLIVVVGIAGLAYDRGTRPVKVETDRQAYETSRSYMQGVAVDLDDLCRQRRGASPEGKAILEDTIRLRAARIDSTKLPSHVQRCLEQVQ